MTPAAEIPNLKLVAVLAAKQKFGIHSILDHVGSAPGAGDHSVEPQVPPHVVSQLLRTAIKLPAALNLQRLRVHDKCAARTVAVGRAKCTQIDSVRSAVDGMRCRIAGAIPNLLGLYDFDDSRLLRIRFDIKDVDARGVDPRNDQI